MYSYYTRCLSRHGQMKLHSGIGFTCETTERAVTEHDALVVADPNGRTAPAVAAIVWPAY